MSSDVDICNLALSHLGDNATVASIDPPEGSAQADHCARFYPMARDAMLELHPWSFATRRAVLAPLNAPTFAWAYCYALPANLLRTIAVLPIDAPDDYTAVGQYTPQPYARESLEDGTEVIYTNQSQASLRYLARVDDAAKFSPLFAKALSWLLASELAGPVLKGDTGQAAAERCLKQFAVWMAKATASDANQRHMIPRDQQHVVSWLAARR
jgi:hypothetical protein